MFKKGEINMCPNNFENFDIFGELPDDSIAISKQILVCFCLDTSYSMISDDKITQLNKCVKNFILEEASNPNNCNLLNICIVTYGGSKAKVIQEFANVKKIIYKDIVPNGATLMGEGVKLAIKKIIEEKQKYNTIGAQMYKPFLIIMSDGKSTDDIKEAVELENQMIDEDKISCKCIGVGIENDVEAIEELKRFSPYKEVVTIDNANMDDIFFDLSRSITGVSQEVIGGFKDGYSD